MDRRGSGAEEREEMWCRELIFIGKTAGKDGTHFWHEK